VVTKVSWENADDGLLEVICALVNAFFLEIFYGDPLSVATLIEIYHVPFYV
jgi:hypothetical protein